MWSYALGPNGIVSQVTGFKESCELFIKPLATRLSNQRRMIQEGIALGNGETQCTVLKNENSMLAHKRAARYACSLTLAKTIRQRSTSTRVPFFVQIARMNDAGQLNFSSGWLLDCTRKLLLSFFLTQVARNGVWSASSPWVMGTKASNTRSPKGHCHLSKNRLQPGPIFLSTFRRGS